MEIKWLLVHIASPEKEARRGVAMEDDVEES